MRLFLISLFLIYATHFLGGCGASKADPRDSECEDSECSSPPQNGCVDNVAVGFSPAGHCERGECVYEQTQTPCEAGTTCRGGICVLDEDNCEGVVCQDPPEPTCNASDVVTYPDVGECQDGVCFYPATYTPCGNDEVCMNAQCYAADDPCASLTCDSPPERRCDGNTVQVFDDAGTCTNGECVYPVVETPCGETATCIDGECDETVNPCDGIECTSPPPRTCAGDTVIIYADTGECQQGECKYSASEEICAADEACAEGACIDPCIGMTCLEPPQDNCDGNDLHTFEAAGTCFLGVCSYVETVTSCGDDKLCYGEACHFIPLVGDLVITEIMYDPAGGDSGYEWFEIQNPTDHAIYVGGLTISDNPSGSGTFSELTVPEGIEIESGAYVVFASSSEAVDGGVTYDWSEWGNFVLANNDDEIILKFNDNVVDKVEYHEDTTFPEAKGASLSLDPTKDASSNDDGSGWCFGVTAYEGLSTTNSPKGYGSPGQVNPPCDFMCFQVECSTSPETCISSTVARQFSGPGVCDSATGQCSDETVGEDIDCVVINGGDLNYICQNGECIDGCEDVFCTTAPKSICDGNSLVTYEQAGSCVAGLCNHNIASTADCGTDTCVETAVDAQCEGDPCEGVPCDAPSSWCDGGTIVDYGGAGVCEGGTCNYETVESRRDCLVTEACYNAECFIAPQPGDLVITEYLANVAGADDGKEWFEVYNPQSESIYLGGLVVKDADSNSFTVPDGVFINAGLYFVFGAGAEAIVGGPDFDWSSAGAFQLANTSDEIILEYSGVVIDSVTYTDCTGCFPHPNGASVSLEPTLFSADNGVGGHWCEGTSTFGVGESLGTPGGANPPCFACVDPAGCPSPANYCEDTTHAFQYGAPSCENDYCDYSSAGSSVDCSAQVCLDGICVDPPI